MTPPEETRQGNLAEARTPPAVSACLAFKIETLRTRPEFLRAASARRQGAGSFLVQARFRDDDRTLVQVGFTASKKVGNSVMRNRARRRLREIVRAVMPQMGQPGWDYVLVARPGVTIDRPYALLLQDLQSALAQIHKPRS